MFNVGDYVTRKSYNNDIVFQIVDIQNDVYYLKGVYIRLYADSFGNDLVLSDYENDNLDSFKPSIDEYRNLDRNEYFYLPGRVLHLDGDKDYLAKCMSFYKRNKVRAYGLYLPENDMPGQVVSLIKKYMPDILVLTGHDSFSRSKRENYKNTSNFALAVTEARRYEKSHERLFIIAASPKRINIHALDPAIIASCLSFSNKNADIDIIKILDKTKYGANGMGGIITKGSMYIGYPR